ncbi:2Fe-2S iron-sulfur cluster-binding protein [Oceanicoccus sp. KOV_DT_Chl]|uniref:2Fe-2S iron-sulfur cluster-binding protein n=1 Tax=Oceanicoccus sp. KOV_DT_Chl TaxID=1904639 RepID=UPI000C7CDCD5|nr:2Fe-2S iron-sulfur cluster-binding protein [Oceanicoccus sp. KOV_DT_Chl]
MAVLNVIDRDGNEAVIESDTGYSIMDVLQANGQDVAAICGGVASCATCHVYVSPEVMATLPPLEGDEQVLVEESEYYKEGQSRLSCQIQFTEALDGIQVILAPED